MTHRRRTSYTAKRHGDRGRVDASDNTSGGYGLGAGTSTIEPSCLDLLLQVVLSERKAKLFSRRHSHSLVLLCTSR